MDIDTLYPLVTEAIRRAEALEARNEQAAREAFSEVSRLEEYIANLVPLTDYEGVIARRGAVRAAIKAHHSGRALELVARFEAEGGVDRELAGDLAKLKAEAIATAMADQEQWAYLLGPRGSPDEHAGDRDLRSAELSSPSNGGDMNLFDHAAIELSLRREQARLRVTFYMTCILAACFLLLHIAAIVALSLPQRVVPESFRSWITLSGAVLAGFLFYALLFFIYPSLLAPLRQERSGADAQRGCNDSLNKKDPAVRSRKDDL
jgi:hypothetical protein